MDRNTALVAIRDAFSDLPPLAAHSTGVELHPDQIFFPLSHAEALDPEVTLVVGNRGMGKSFWAAALAQPSTRRSISEAYPSARSYGLSSIDVTYAFADAEGGAGSTSKAELNSIDRLIPTETIWRAVIIKQLAAFSSIKPPNRLREIVDWILTNPEDQQNLLRQADQYLSSSNSRHLFLFDQLDQLADTWPRIQQLTQGIFRTALAMRSYRSIRTKIFIRPDQVENKELFRFPDASKVAGARARLRWRSMDLYGLLFFELFRNPSTSVAINFLCSELSIPTAPMNRRLRIPDMLAYSPEAQRILFDVIAGPFMGATKKRGLTYTWIPAHLADAQGETSPRTFLKAIKTAADHRPPPSVTAIDYQGIQEGVREASENRLSDLQEDYPWVSTALEPLRGLLVPCEAQEILDRWEGADAVEAILSEYQGAKAPLGLDPNETGLAITDPGVGLLTTLAEIGVIETRPNGKVNVPDIFRINAGILRKGGITPQQRERLHKLP